MIWDCVVVGGGPAGLSSALVLGRCARRVLLLDDGRYRNHQAAAVNGYLTRDGTPPAMLRELGRAELERYGVVILPARAVTASRRGDAFRITLEGNTQLDALTVVIATGVRDVLPALPGLLECFGATVHHCPYCDAWEHRGKAIAVYGAGGEQLAATMRGWSNDVVLFSVGPIQDLDVVRAAGVAVVEQPVVRFEHRNDRLQALVLASGVHYPRSAAFLKLAGGQAQRSDLAAQLGIPTQADGGLAHDGHGVTRVDGVFVCGDVTRDLLLSIVAASEGAEVAVKVNNYLGRRGRYWPPTGGRWP